MTCRLHSHFCLFTRLFGDSVGLSSNNVTGIHHGPYPTHRTNDVLPFAALIVGLGSGSGELVGKICVQLALLAHGVGQWSNANAKKIQENHRCSEGVKRSMFFLQSTSLSGCQKKMTGWWFVNPRLGMEQIPPIKMVMAGEWFMIVLPTLSRFPAG